MGNRTITCFPHRRKATYDYQYEYDHRVAVFAREEQIGRLFPDDWRVSVHFGMDWDNETANCFNVYAAKAHVDLARARVADVGSTAEVDGTAFPIKVSEYIQYVPLTREEPVFVDDLRLEYTECWAWPWSKPRRQHEQSDPWYNEHFDEIVGYYKTIRDAIGPDVDAVVHHAFGHETVDQYVVKTGADDLQGTRKRVAALGVITIAERKFGIRVGEVGTFQTMQA